MNDSIVSGTEADAPEPMEDSEAESISGGEDPGNPGLVVGFTTCDSCTTTALCTTAESCALGLI